MQLLSWNVHFVFGRSSLLTRIANRGSSYSQKCAIFEDVDLEESDFNRFGGIFIATNLR